MLHNHCCYHKHNQPKYQQQQQPQQYQQQMNNYRPNSYENMRQMPLDAWRSPIPPQSQIQSQMPSLLDASLADILKRPPVGYKPQPQFPPYPPNQMQQMNNDMYEPTYRCKLIFYSKFL